jgi:hypothetical protein
LELISRLETEAKERRNAPQRLERDEEGKLKPLPQLIGEEVDDKHVREATHHLARVFSTNRQYVSDAGKGRALETFRAKAYWVPKFVQ